MRDARYDIIKSLLRDGKVRTFSDIFLYVPKTIVARDLGTKVDRFTKLMNKVESFTLEEIFTIGKFCNMDEKEMLSLVMDEYYKNKKKDSKLARADK